MSASPRLICAGIASTLGDFGQRHDLEQVIEPMCVDQLLQLARIGHPNSLPDREPIGRSGAPRFGRFIARVG